MTTLSRRHFLGAAAAASAGLYATLQTQPLQAQSPNRPPFPSELYKARITAVPTDEICEAWKKAGFEGMEVTKWDPTIEEARASRAIAEKHGISIHSVMRGWTNFNQPNNFNADVESVKTALRAAAAYGADAILLVPARISGMSMPEPWNFEIDFDPKTLQIKTVAEGDNAPYADYIAAHNIATDASIRAIESLIPTAAREGVRICIENVWNNLWSTPKFFAAFCKYFDNPWVGCYFDLGNHTRYARCEEWIKELGHSIVKLHIKGFNVTEVRGRLGGGPGDWARIDRASIDWVSVRKLLAEKRYNGWLTIEEGGATDEEYSAMLDKIIAM
ncbi:MAG: sugar phosphate isomerase/epimerase [Planctomycetaceae bacterium]|nr:sugar phosphate isomerase/epimerase [Planctomycetaceae bacterium]